jgi:hypothetical protein
MRRLQACALGGNRRSHLFQAVLAHGLGKDRVGFTERVDPVDKVNIEFTHVHRKLAHVREHSRFRWPVRTQRPWRFSLDSAVEVGQRGEWWRSARPWLDCCEPIQPRSRFFDGYVTVGTNMFGSSMSTSMMAATGRHRKCEAGWVGRVGIARAQRRRSDSPGGT